jgi:hypothetical protein
VKTEGGDDMNKPNHPIQGLAAIRRSYEEVVGLEILQEINESEGKYVFYAVGAGG